MRSHIAGRSLAVAVPVLLGACSVVEIGYDVRVRLKDDVDQPIAQERTVRVWVVQDQHLAWDGGYYFWCDTLLWPIDAVASVVYWCSDASDPRVRTRWPGPLGWIARLGSVVLPGVSAKRREANLEWSILGLGAWPSTSVEDEGLEILHGSGDIASVKAALVAQLMANTDSLVCEAHGAARLRDRIMSGIVDIEWIEP